MAKPKNHVLKADSGSYLMNFTSTARLRVFRPLPDDSPCYALVGMIAAETARIERLIDTCICKLAKVDLRIGASLTGQMIGPNPRFNALIQLAKERGISDAIIRRLNKMSVLAGGHFERRNRAVHDPWLEEAGSGESHQHRGKSKRDPVFGPIPVSDQELRDTLTELRRHRDAVNCLVADIYSELTPTSQRTPP